MSLSLVEAHLICLVLVLGDLVARGYRQRWYLRGLGRELSFADALNATAWGDAAAGLTPLRFGGEAAKFTGLLRGKIPAGLAVVALGLEAAVTYPLVALVGLWLAWRFAPSWWSQVEPMVSQAVTAGWPWLVGVLVITVLAIGCGVRWRDALKGRIDQPTLRVGDLLRRTPLQPILLGALISLYNILARTAVLPLLALTLPQHPPIGILLLGSFALLYSQLILPTPAGVGAVDLGFLAGVAGNLGSGAPGLLVAWRFYTVGVGVALGVVLAVRAFGWAALRRLMKR